MAQQKKKTTTTKKKTTGSSRSSSSGKRTAKKNQKRPIRREVAGAILLVLALCLGFSYFQSGAWLLDQPAKLCRSLFGWGYYLVAPALLLGILALLMVDYIQLLVPQLYRLVINGVNLGQVVVRGETMPFTKEVLFQHICLPMIWIVLFMVVGRFLWRICFFGTSIRVQADLREKMFDHSRRLSQQYYQVNKVGNLMSLYTNDLDTIQECFGDGILMFFDALVLGLLALYRMWCMDRRMTMLALIPAAFMFAIGTVMGKTMTLSLIHI